MKFRTLLTDPKSGGPKPVQAFHPDQSKAREWATAVLAKASPQAYVTLYTEIEVEVFTWKQEPTPAPTTVAKV